MSEWHPYRIKDIAQLISIKSEDLTLPYIALDNIISWDATFVPSDSATDGNSNLCEAGDVLFGKLRPYLAKAYIPTKKSICSPEFLVLRPNEGTNNKFLLYFLLSRSFISHIRNQVVGVKMPRTNWLQISRYPIFMPSPEEQEEIAEYLDKECEKIGCNIELLERKADAYKRLRRSIINCAVTRGLNPDVPLKSSGNDWIDDIPAHWDYERVEKYFHSNTTLNKNFEYTRAFKFYMGTIIPKDENFDEEEYRDVYEKYTIVEKNDIMINGLNLNYDLKSMRVGIVPYNGIITSAYVVLRPFEGVNAQYFNYLFKAFDYRKFFHGMGKGVRLTLSFNELRTFEIPVPPKDEQNQIVAYLDEKCDKIDAVIENIGTLIERLKELKRSLINEVVTGKRAIPTYKP